MRERDVTQWSLVELAESQEGVLRHRDLLGAGLDKSAIVRRLERGHLHRKHRGVYTLGHSLLRPRGEWMAAVWSVPGSVLSHWSAAAFHGWIDSPEVQHVSTVGGARSRPAVQVHRMPRISLRDVERSPHLAVTTQARTIVDLAAVLPWPELRAIADRVRTLSVPAIRAAAARASDRRGATSIRRLCERLEAHTKSEFERRYLRFCRRRGVPLPDAVNGPLHGVKADCTYVAQRLVVELDGRAFHARRDQMRSDRRRDRKLLGSRVATVRLVWEDLDEDAAEETAADLLRIMRGRAPGP